MSEEDLALGVGSGCPRLPDPRDEHVPMPVELAKTEVGARNVVPRPAPVKLIALSGTRQQPTSRCRERGSTRNVRRTGGRSFTDALAAARHAMETRRVRWRRSRLLREASACSRSHGRAHGQGVRRADTPGLRCPACRRPLKLHHVQTLAEHDRAFEQAARGSVNVQRYGRRERQRTGQDPSWSRCALPGRLLPDDTAMPAARPEGAGLIRCVSVSRALRDDPFWTPSASPAGRRGSICGPPADEAMDEMITSEPALATYPVEAHRPSAPSSTGSPLAASSR